MKAGLGTFPKDRQILHEILPLDTPLGVDIHTTHFCNFKCNYCVLCLSDEELASSEIKREIMTWETFELLVNQLKEFPRKIKMITMSGIGEATTHPKVVDMVQLLDKSNVTNKIQIISNGALLTPKLGEKLIEAGLNELRISLQGLSSEKYRQICGANIDWDEYYANLCYFSKIKGSCALKVKIVDTALNPGDDKKFYELFGDICDNVAIEYVYDAWKANGYPQLGNNRTGMKTRYGREFRQIKVCHRPFIRFDILPSGKFTQFCHTCFGHEKNIREMSVVEQWNSVNQNQLRRDMLNGRRFDFEQRKNCSMIEEAWHPEDILDGREAEILARMGSM